MHGKHPDTPRIASARWIWLNQKAAVPNQYVCFRKAFHLQVLPREAWLEISVDSDFVLWINGAEVSRGQFSDYPERKSFTRLSVRPFLRKGRNLVCVLAYHRGEDSSEHRRGLPGLILALEAGKFQLTTDNSWEVRQHPAFQSGKVPRVTFQQGFTVSFDARRDIVWQTPRPSDRGWSQAKVLAGATDGFWKALFPRPVPPLRIGPEVPVRLVAQGVFLREKRWRNAFPQRILPSSGKRPTTPNWTVAEVMMEDALVSQSPVEAFDLPHPSFEHGYHRLAETPTDFLRQPDHRWLKVQPPPRGKDGRFFIVDLGREEVGLLRLRLKAPSGTVVDLAHGEHLDDGRVRATMGERHFADRYICREGINDFTLPFRRLGCRYLEVHLSRFKRPVEINYVGLKPLELPISDEGDFRTHDELVNRMHDLGRRTLKLCMHEHYEDCPWREQSLYAFDSRNQALYGYYAFGNYDFAAASFELLGRGLRDDGLLELCAPGRVSVNIPMFSLVWITALAEHGLFSGRPDLFQMFRAQIESMLGKVFDRWDPRSGLYRSPGGPGMWLFYDWMDGLDHSPVRRKTGEHLAAPYNLFLHEALGSYAWMLSRAGDASLAEVVQKRRRALGKSICRIFWNPRQQALASYLVDGKQTHFCELVQALALSEGIASSAESKHLVRHLFRKDLHPVTLSSALYLQRGLWPRGPSARRFFSRQLMEKWSAMTFAGATSFWETERGGDDFDRAGSLCHAWSALPLYHHQACVLGVRPLTAGFEHFLIAPYTDNLFEVSGSVPTPRGTLRIKWNKTPEGLEVTADGPDSLKPTLGVLTECAVRKAVYNGKPIQTDVPRKPNAFGSAVRGGFRRPVTRDSGPG